MTGQARAEVGPPDLDVVAEGGVTSPQGFLAGAVYAGLQQPAPDQLDLGAVLSDRPAAAAARFTTNRVVAAPVVVSRERLDQGRPLRGAVFNAGNANACTGADGLAAAREMAALAAKRLGVAPDELVVASTGVIGVPLDVDKVREGVGRLEVSRDGGSRAARAIMTTDLRPKQVAVELDVAGGRVTVGGMAKGSGMIHPDLATMLAFLTTDAPLDRAAADVLLGSAVDASFNMITVDGDTSTNDMVLLLANGAAGTRELSDAETARVGAALDWVCVQLARAIAADGEGATRLIEVVVAGARDVSQARRAARAIAGSNLVKAAVYGADPNWGRILAALGRCGVDLDPEGIDVHVGEVAVARRGSAVPFDAEAASAALRATEVRLHAHLNLGEATATAWGCDLTERYVAINSEYTT
jgi:glutamate N-acetyltransferase/amino-acid N-acetyltransferase